MKINLTKKQYRDLLLATCIGVYIRGGVDEREGKDFSKAEEIERHLLSFAKDFDSEDLTQVAYEIEINNLQEAGTDYTATLTYIATPVF